jgi:hypothetical protein
MPSASATRKNTAKITAAQKNAIRKSLSAFNAKFRTFNVGKPPSQEAAAAALKALLAKRGGGKTRRLRRR